MSLKHSYTLIAPFYDSIIRAPLERLRVRSLAGLPPDQSARILLNGIGTGLDLPHLPEIHRYVGVDLTAAMLHRTRPRIGKLDLTLVQGDSQRLPFRDACFDHAILHLILAVVPDGASALREVARVLKPGGRIFLLDKFLKSGEPALARRLLNPLASRIATRTDVVFEDLLARVQELKVLQDEPAMLGGWFRLIQLEKREPEH